MPKSNILFWDGDGSEARRQHVANVSSQADRISDASVLEGDHEALAAEIASAGSVQVPVLDRTDISYERKQRTVDGEDHWGERRRYQQTVLQFEVPFTGDSTIFKLRPMTYDSGPPYADVGRTSLIVSIVDNNDPEATKRELDRTLDDIEKYLGWHKPLWENVQADITHNVTETLRNRKQKLEQHRKSDDGLAAFGFKPKGTQA